MGLKHVLGRVLRRVEVVDVDKVDEHASKKMAAVGEDNLTTCLDGYILILLNSIGEDIHHPDTIEEADNDLEACWMEGDTHGIILELLIDLQFEAKRWAVTPDLHSLVRGAGGNQILLNAHIHTGDRPRVERMHQILVGSFHALWLIVEQADVHSINLVVIRGEYDLVLTSRQINGFDGGSDNGGNDLLLLLVHLVVEGIGERCHHLVGVVKLRGDAVHHHLALVTHNDEALRVSDDFLNVETVAWVVIQRSSDFAIWITNDELSLVSSDQDPAICQPAVSCVVLRDVTILLLGDLAHLGRQILILLNVELVGLITGDEDVVHVDRAEADLGSNGVASRMRHCLLSHASLLVDLPDVD